MSTLAYAAIYAALRDAAPPQVANGALAVTTLASTQANREFTFDIRATAGILAGVATIARFLLLRLWLERHRRMTLVRKSAGG